MTENKRLLRSLRNMSVLVIHPLDEDGENLVGQIKRIGCRVKRAWPAPETKPNDVDIVFFLVDADHWQPIEWIESDQNIGKVALISYENPTVLEVVTSTNVHGVITKPIRSFGILARLATAMSLRNYHNLLNTRIMKLDENLRTRRYVEKATKILSKMRNISEDEAYSAIRGEAMNKQITLYEMAKAIINADNLFKFES